MQYSFQTTIKEIGDIINKYTNLSCEAVFTESADLSVYSASSRPLLWQWQCISRTAVFILFLNPTQKIDCINTEVCKSKPLDSGFI